jgi:GLPGLI family protein
MKFFLTLAPAIAALCLFSTKAQFSRTDSSNLEAKYLVKSERYTTHEGKQKLIAILEFEGILKKKGNRYICYSKPLYLDKYPNGYIDYQFDGDPPISYGIPVDSFYTIQYADMDSMIIRYHHHSSNIAGIGGRNNYFTFEPGFRQWNILNETRTINGLLCQKATIAGRNSTFEIWFAPDINVAMGPVTLMELPGLVVEAVFPELNETWSLKEFSTGRPMDDAEFWPPPFNAPFRFINHLKRKQ